MVLNVATLFLVPEQVFDENGIVDFIERHTSVITLDDGTMLTVRPITPDDASGLVEAFEMLSPESRYMRFLRPMDQLSSYETSYLTNIDYHDHFAWVAIVDGQGVGVARYIRNADEPDTAEAAVVVADAWQRRGIATILLGLLGETAWTNGIRHFAALISAENSVVKEGLQSIGARLESENSTMAMTIDLPFPEEAIGDSALMNALRTVARGFD